MALSECPKCKRLGVEFDPRCKSNVCLFEDCRHSFNDPEPSSLDALLSLLKPLEWEQESFYHESTGLLWLESWTAKTSFGSFSVCRSGDNYYFKFADDDAVQCNSIDHGKELCQADYVQRVAKLFRERGE